MPPASRASSTAKSRYSISPLIQDGLPWSVFGREFRNAVHDLDESFLLSKGGECRFGLDLVEFLEAFIERPVEVGDGEIFVPAGSVEFCEIVTDGGIASAGRLNQCAEPGRYAIQDFRIQLERALCRFGCFVVALHIEEASAHVQIDRRGFGMNAECFLVLRQRTVVTFPAIFN